MLSFIARLWLRLGGWTLVGEHPAVDKAVVIAAPHTSNWDGLWGLVAKVAFKVDVRFFGKESLFWFPLGTILRGMGGIPLNRSAPGSAVEQAIESFKTHDQFYFGMAPEGTRSLKDSWKSGFYRIATGANVPVILAFFDYENRRLGLGPTLAMSGDPDVDMETIRMFYLENGHGKRPDQASPIALPPDRH